MNLDMQAVLNAAIALLNVVMMLALLRVALTFGRRMPWLVLIAVYFGARAFRRVAVMAGETIPADYETWVDLLLLPLLLTLLLGWRAMAHSLTSVHDEAKVRSEEYERALRDYAQLMRHRIANPLAVVCGGVNTLRDHPEMDAELRARLLNDIAEAGARLEKVALEPDPMSEEERSLMARPQIEA